MLGSREDYVVLRTRIRRLNLAERFSRYCALEFSDEPRYVNEPMRQLLAFLALITGFAAFYAPAQAAVGNAANVEVQRPAEGEQPTKMSGTACARRQRAQRSGGQPVTPCASQPVVIYLPTVQFGPDRALE